MKTMLFALCFLWATAAFGQSVLAGTALSNEPTVLQISGHPEHASRQPMGAEQNLLIPSPFVAGHGQRPLWEVAPVRYEIPLGDSARMLKKEHATVQKAQIVWEN